MKTFAFLVVFGCVITSLTAVQDTAPPFTVECSSPSDAKLTLNNGKEIRGILPCKPVLSESKYNIKSCLSENGAFVVLPSNAGALVANSAEIKEYHVSCIENEDGIVANISLKNIQFGTSVSPSYETFTVKEDLQVPDLLLLNTTPTQKSEIDGHKITEASLGQSIYLTVVSKVSGTLDLIPLWCEAKAGGTRADLWKLNAEQTGNKCFKESVMKTPFSMKDDYSVAQIEAFTFADAFNEEITITCEVRVCKKNAKGLCKRDKDALSHCNEITTSPTPPTPPTTPTQNQAAGRRRRAAGVSPSDIGGVHHVTATLRIRDDVMTTAASTNVYYHMYSLILPLLVKIYL